MKKIELLAPAGDLDKLKVAIHYGADAVYVGDRFFSLRGKAGNFTLRQLKEGVLFAHERGKKVYAAVNIFAYNRDFRRIENYLKILQDEIGLDALIVTDPGVIALARKVIPNMELHLSTQANTLNVHACAFWKEQGIRRVILARELSFEDIRAIAASKVVDVEIFVHGSICIAYSGRCFISNYLTKYRDANRGLCTNSCRWNYSLEKADYRVEEKERPGEYFPLEEDGRGSYLFNSKDLNLVHRLDEILSSGVCSIKIEGRTKSLTYLATVVAAYRKTIDAWYQGNSFYKDALEEAQKELMMLGGRGYTEGLFKGKGPEDYNYEGRQTEQNFEFAGMILPSEEKTLLKTSIKKKIMPGDLVSALLPDLSYRTVRIQGLLTLDHRVLDRALPGETVYLKTADFLSPYTVLRCFLPQTQQKITNS